jgi:hypothetical protein
MPLAVRTCPSPPVRRADANSDSEIYGWIFVSAAATRIETQLRRLYSRKRGTPPTPNRQNLIVGFTTIVPSPICFAIAFVFVTRSFGIFGLTVPRPTPSFFRLNV